MFACVTALLVAPGVRDRFGRRTPPGRYVSPFVVRTTVARRRAAGFAVVAAFAGAVVTDVAGAVAALDAAGVSATSGRPATDCCVAWQPSVTKHAARAAAGAMPRGRL